MTGIAILLGGAALGFGIAQWLRLPAIPFMLLIGLAISSFGLVPDPDIVGDALVLGITFLVFVAGIELNSRRVGPYRRAAVKVGLAQFLLLGFAGISAALVLGYAVMQSLYLGLALAASSTLVVVRLLQQRRQMFEPFGRLVIGVLLFQDLVVIVLIPVLVFIPDGVGPALLGFVLALGLVGMAFVFMRWIVPFLLLRHQVDVETLLLIVLAVLFIFLGAAYAANLPFIAGAFLAGVALSRFPVSGIVRGQLNSIGDFFAAIFFTALGAVISLPGWTELLHALVLSSIVILITPPLVTIVAERAGLSSRPSLESGLLLSQTSEFSIIVGIQGIAAGQLSNEIFTVIALTTCITMILTPFVSTDQVTWRLMRMRPSIYRRSAAYTPSNHILMLGCGENGMPLLETLVLAGYDVFVVDDDPEVIRRLRENDVPCLLGDGADSEVLNLAGIERAQIIVSLMRRPADSVAMLKRAGNVPALVRVFNEENAAQIEAAGGTPILYARATADAFLQWFHQFEAERASTDSGQVNALREPAS